MKYLVIILSLFFLYACNTKKEKGAPESEAKTMHEAHEEASPELKLNGTMKWKADVPTNENVKALQDITRSFVRADHTALDDFMAYSADMQSGLDKMIRECRMKGPDHDALHNWLVPVITRVKALKSPPSLQEANKSLDEIQHQLNVYNKYFE